MSGLRRHVPEKFKKDAVVLPLLKVVLFENSNEGEGRVDPFLSHSTTHRLHVCRVSFVEPVQDSSFTKTASVCSDDGTKPPRRFRPAKTGSVWGLKVLVHVASLRVLLRLHVSRLYMTCSHLFTAVVPWPKCEISDVAICQRVLLPCAQNFSEASATTAMRPF